MKFLFYALAGVVLDVLSIFVLIAMILHGYFVGAKTSVFTGVVNATAWFPVTLACAAMIMEASQICKRKSDTLGLFGCKR